MEFWIENWMITVPFVIGGIAMIANAAIKGSNASKTYATKNCVSCKAVRAAAYGPCGKCGLES